MMSPNIASLILRNAHLHALHEEFQDRPVAEGMIHVTDTWLRGQRLRPEGFDDAVYDGAEHIYKGKVHVFYRDGLRERARMTLSEYTAYCSANKQSLGNTK